MDSPHTGSRDQAVELLRVETELFTLYLQGKPYHPTVETLQLHRSSEQEWVEATLGITCSERLGEVQIKVFSPETYGLVEWVPGRRLFLAFMRRNLTSWWFSISRWRVLRSIMRMCCSGRR